MKHLFALSALVLVGFNPLARAADHAICADRGFNLAINSIAEFSEEAPALVNVLGPQSMANADFCLRVGQYLGSAAIVFEVLNTYPDLDLVTGDLTSEAAQLTVFAADACGVSPRPVSPAFLKRVNQLSSAADQFMATQCASSVSLH